MKDVLDKLNFASFKIGPSDGQGGGAGAYKEVDLHGFPLSVAKAAVDFLFSEIVDKAMCIEADIGLKGEAEGEGGSSSGAMTVTARAIERACTFDLKIVTGRGKHRNSSGTFPSFIPSGVNLSPISLHPL